MMNKKFAITSDHIERLKSSYRKSGYSVDVGGPDWLEAIAGMSERDYGVLALVGPSGVNVSTPDGDRDRIWPDAPSMYLAGIAGHIRIRRSRISIGLPPHARDLPLFLACTSVLRRAFEEVDSTAFSNTRGVLIVSPDIGLRSKYCDLLVDREHLESVFPGSRMLFNGKIQPLTKDNSSGSLSGVCFFLPQRKILPNKIAMSPDLIILDFRYSRLVTKSEEIVQWAVKVSGKPGILALYTCGDRLSSIVLRKSDFVDFPLDHVGIQTCINFNKRESGDCSTGSLDLRLMSAPGALVRKHVVNEVPASRELRETIREITVLLEQHRETGHIELNKIRWLFSAYSQMCTPLVWHENAARDRGRWVLKSVVSRIGTSSRDIGTLGPSLQTFRALFAQLNRLYELESPKAEEVSKHVLGLSEKLSKDKRLMILVRDEVMQHALSSWLSLAEFFGTERLEFVDIVAARNYITYSHREYRYFLSPGSLHYRYRWILGANLGSQVHFLTYPHEIAVINEQISQFYDRRYLDYRATRRSEALARLTMVQPKGSSKEIILCPTLDIVMPKISPVGLPPKRQTPKKIVSLDDLMAVVQGRKEEAKQENEELTAPSGDTYEDINEDIPAEYSERDLEALLVSPDGVQCHKVTLSSQEKGLGTMWIADHRFVEFVRPENSEDLYRLTPDHLIVGDLLLRLDQRQQQGIFERLIEISDNNPQMEYISTYRIIWRKAIELLESKFRDARGRVDYSQMLGALINQGIEITTTQTLQNWVNDVVIGPADISSIVAVGKASGIVDLSKRSREFDKNFARIRSLHRSVGRRIAGIIRRTFLEVALTSEASGDDLDSKIGIPLEEIVQSIDICEVIAVSKADELINPDLIGAFIKAEE